MHLLAQRLGVAPPPGCGVAVAMVTLCLRGVDEEPGRRDETWQEVVTEL